MANFTDFAVGIVVTPPSPATTGVTLTLRAGEGATMPPVPFYVTGTPPGQLTTIGTSEKLLVSAVAVDTLTFTRAQSPTTAKTITAGWIIANAIYSTDVTASSIVMDQLLTGTPNGVLTAFTTASAFSGIIVYKNGVTLHVTDDYTITNTTTITMLTAPATGTKLTATYIMGSSVMINGSNSQIFDDAVTGLVNGANTSFTALRPYIAGSLQVFINGIKQKRITHFTETTPTTGVFTMSDAPLTGDDVMVNYQYVLSVSGNADTVDGYHGDDLMPVGAGMEYWGTVLPSANWLFVYGQAISRTTYSVLFSRLGTVFGVGDGLTTFNLPDKRGRVSAGLDNMGGTSANRLTNPGSIGGMDGDILGNVGGQEAHVQTTAELVIHSHTVPARDTDDAGTGGAVRGTDAGVVFPTGNAGSSAASNIVQPTIISNYIMKVL